MSNSQFKHKIQLRTKFSAREHFVPFLGCTRRNKTLGFSRLINLSAGLVDSLQGWLWEFKNSYLLEPSSSSINSLFLFLSPLYSLPSPLFLPPLYFSLYLFFLFSPIYYPSSWLYLIPTSLLISFLLSNKFSFLSYS